MASSARQFLCKGMVDDIHWAQRRLVQHVVLLLPTKRFASTRAKASAVVQALEAEGKRELKSPTPDSAVVTSVLARLAALYTSSTPRELPRHQSTVTTDIVSDGSGAAVENTGIQSALVEHVRRVQLHPAYQNSKHPFYEAALAEASRIRAGDTQWRQDLFKGLAAPLTLGGSTATTETASTTQEHIGDSTATESNIATLQRVLAYRPLGDRRSETSAASALVFLTLRNDAWERAFGASSTASGTCDGGMDDGDTHGVTAAGRGDTDDGSDARAFLSRCLSQESVDLILVAAVAGGHANVVEHVLVDVAAVGTDVRFNDDTLFAALAMCAGEDVNTARDTTVTYYSGETQGSHPMISVDFVQSVVQALHICGHVFSPEHCRMILRLALQTLPVHESNDAMVAADKDTILHTINLCFPTVASVKQFGQPPVGVSMATKTAANVTLRRHRTAEELSLLAAAMAHAGRVVACQEVLQWLEDSQQFLDATFAPTVAASLASHGATKLSTDLLCHELQACHPKHKQELLTCIHHVLRCCGPDRESPPRGGHAWRQNRRHGGDAAESGARLAQRIVHACEHAKLWEPGGDESADRGNGQQHRVSIGFFTPSSPGPLSQVPTATATKPLLTDDELRHVHSLALLAGAALPSPRSPASSARNGDVSDVVPMTSAQDTPTHGLKYTAGVYAAIVTEMLARGSAPHREVVQDLLTAVESEGGVAAVDGRPAYGTEEYAGVPTNTPHYVSHPPVYLQVQRDTHLAQVLVATARSSIAAAEHLGHTLLQRSEADPTSIVNTPVGVGAVVVALLRATATEESHGVHGGGRWEEVLRRHCTAASQSAAECTLGFVLARAQALGYPEAVDTILGNLASFLPSSATDVGSGSTANEGIPATTPTVMPAVTSAVPVHASFAAMGTEASSQAMANFATGVVIRASQEFVAAHAARTPSPDTDTDTVPDAGHGMDAVGHNSDAVVSGREAPAEEHALVALYRKCSQHAVPLRKAAHATVFSLLTKGLGSADKALYVRRRKAVKDTPTPSGALSANEVLRLVFEQVDAGVDVMTIQGIVTMVLRSFALQNDFKNAYRLFSTQVEKPMASNIVTLGMVHEMLKAIRSRSALTKINDILQQAKYIGLTPTAATYGVVAAKHAQYGNYKGALRVWDTIQRKEIPLTTHTATTLVGVANRLGADGYADLCAIDADATAQPVRKDAFYCDQVLHGHSQAVHRAFVATRVPHAWQGAEAVHAHATGAVQAAMQAFDDMQEHEITPSLWAYNSMALVAACTANAALATRLRKHMTVTNTKPSITTFQHLVTAYGFSGDLASVTDCLQQLDDTEGVEMDMPIITQAIFAHGLYRDIDGAMHVYDRMLELGLKPDEALNDVLIHVCKIDPISVIMNAQS